MNMASSLCFHELPGAPGAQQSLGTLQRELASEQALLAWRLVQGGWHLHICTLAPEVMLMSTAIASCTEGEGGGRGEDQPAVSKKRQRICFKGSRDQELIESHQWQAMKIPVDGGARFVFPTSTHILTISFHYVRHLTVYTAESILSPALSIYLEGRQYIVIEPRRWRRGKDAVFVSILRNE